VCSCGCVANMKVARMSDVQSTDTATHCNTLQHTATHCNTLQQQDKETRHTAARGLLWLCRKHGSSSDKWLRPGELTDVDWTSEQVCCSVCCSVYCSVCCIMLQCLLVGVRSNCAAVCVAVCVQFAKCCNVLQCAAVPVDWHISFSECRVCCSAMQRVAVSGLFPDCVGAI